MRLYDRSIDILKEFFTQHFIDGINTPMRKLTHDITSQDFLHFLYSKNLSENSIANYWSWCKALYKLAIKKKAVESNPFEENFSTNYNESDPLTKNELKKINEYLNIAPQWFSQILYMGLYTGMRRSELNNLKWVILILIIERRK